MTGHSRQEQEALRADLRDLGWTLAVGPGDLLRAERGGTLRWEQAALTPDGLLAAVQAAEERITTTTPVAVATGLQST